ncbi:hypothetical protein [Corallococcus exercitus]|uniref:hypothetical protein n=1 Tax=Corallococcus exercitus TaxID=2316736 RepID=UPI0035D4E771
MFEKRKGWKGRSVWLLGAMLAAGGCSKATEPTGASPGTITQRAEQETSTSKLGELPKVEGESAARVFAQRLEKPTSLKETTAVNVKLAPPANKELSDSLVRVVGGLEEPVVLFRSDALAELGLIPKSPGPEFFTLFTEVTDEALDLRTEREKEVAEGKFGEVTRETILFNGRHPAARFEGLEFQAQAFRSGALTLMDSCPARPASTQALWEKVLLIRDAQVVQDPARTWDPCTNQGTRGGVWTFAHLMRQLATGSGKSAEDFTLEWLSRWLNDYTVNGDVVPQRRQEMFDQVIRPWAIASGGDATLMQVGTQWHAAIIGDLDLDIAPFRLLAIVNRIDLASNTGGGYGGSSSAGELRFVFGMTQPQSWGVPGGTEATCGLKPFTTIVEYGVPRSGCQQVIDYARQWADLGTHAGFDAAYLSKLETLTQGVVLAGKAPSKGNGSALNQLRTNEIALAPGGQWELREFQLADEDPNAGTTTPGNGPLRPHTVALTPNDATHDSQVDPDVNTHVLGPVENGLNAATTVVPSSCVSSFTVPHKVNGNPFLGGHALVDPPTHWEAFGVNPGVATEVCARKEFSGNTCNGCHFGDTALDGTNGNNAFMHISATSGIPATPSKFLTGGGSGFMFSVPDQQFPGLTSWPFADLMRRHQRLYDIATCSTCSRFFVLDPGLLSEMEALAGVVPFDGLAGGVKEPPFKVGPIRDLETVKKLFESRASFAKEPRDLPLNFLRPPETFVH